MEYKMVMGIEKIITYDDIPRDGDTRYQYTLETEQKLINYIRVGEFEYAKDLFEGILVTNFHRSKISAKLKRCFMVDIVGTILRVSEEAQLQYSEVEHILDCKSTEDMKNEILKVIEKACNNINNLKQVVNKGNDFIEKSIELIKNNFSDENLNISFIADNLDISPDYLSRIFKNHTGESMLDYICKIRLTKAKELLVKKESIIAEIAKETGFSNVNTFIRIFKKHEGVTPGQYKSLEV
jgi:YesN/AraC family two-component response regulator